MLGTLAPAESAFNPADLHRAVERVREPAHILRHPDGFVGVGFGTGAGQPLEWLGTLPALYPEWLGDRSFQEAHGTRYAYIAGAMANGIASTDIVIAIAKAGGIGFFGAAGLPESRVSAAIDTIQAALGKADEGGLPHGFNLIHSPQEPELEAAVADLYLRRGIRRVSAAAYMGLTPWIVRYAITGLTRTPDGRIHRKNHVFAKISRPEVARRFLAPAPPEILAQLVRDRLITVSEAELARSVPIAEDITMESDSGGHTDNQPLGAVLPILLRLRDDMVRQHGYTRPIRIGAAGGLGTPNAVASAFALGAAYVLTGSVNQASIEAALAPNAKEMLCKADAADVAMAPAADMFEMGVEVQVLKRGTLFAARGHKLRDIYQRFSGLSDIPPEERQKLERDIFKDTLENVWAKTDAFFQERDPKQLARARADEKHKMALVFRAYLGQSSKWAIAGAPDRIMDYQIWCGPAMGSFNQWVKGSFLEPASGRTVTQIALNLLEGAAVVTRAGQLRSYGVPVPAEAWDFRPRLLG